MTLLGPEDLAADDAKGRAALARYALSLVTTEADPAFEIAYGLLDGEFGAKGELETRAAIRGYLARATPPGGYRLVLARDERGDVAGVRDCHASVDVAAGVIVVFLSHVLVLPPHRGSGLASLLREVPAALGRSAAAEATLERPEIMLAAEMEPVVLDSPETIVRLVAYGRAGFSVVDPAALPYGQPDYREHARIDADRPRPIPLLAVVKRLGRETERTIPKALAAAFVEHLYRIVGSHCREQDLARPRDHALGALARAPGERVRLLDLPRGMEDRAALSPLLREVVLRYHPPDVAGVR